METNKLAIAIEFLDTAATLWKYEINYFSAIHLAAAAEEISGKACRIDNKSSNFDEVRMFAKRALSSMRIAYTEKQLKEAAYAVKNAIKHMDSRSDSSINISAREEAARYILAAHYNFKTLGMDNLLSEDVMTVIDANAIQIDIDS